MIRDAHRLRPPFAARALALLHTAMYDAMVASFDSRRAYKRVPPWRLDPRLDPLIKERGSSYPPAQAVIAGAAEKMLTYLFPDESPETFAALADQATESRLWAGANYRSDVVRGRALGNRVARLFIERGQTDGHTNTVSSEPPQGEQFWEPTPPAKEEPTGRAVGTWTPWLMTSQDAARVRSGIPGPHAYGSDAFMAELREVMEVQANLDSQKEQIAFFWDDGPGTFTPPGHWNDIALELIASRDLGTKATTRLFAVLNVALADAAIANFEAKYHWWSIRPITAIHRLCDDGARLCTKAELEADPARATYPQWQSLIITPPFPGYPGGHSTFSGAGAAVLEHFFPDAAGVLNHRAEEAAESRLYGGIHFRSDNDAGLQLGRTVADMAIERAQTDGSGL